VGDAPKRGFIISEPYFRPTESNASTSARTYVLVSSTRMKGPRRKPIATYNSSYSVLSTSGKSRSTVDCARGQQSTLRTAFAAPDRTPSNQHGVARGLRVRSHTQTNTHTHTHTHLHSVGLCLRRSNAHHLALGAAFDVDEPTDFSFGCLGNNHTHTFLCFFSRFLSAHLYGLPFVYVCMCMHMPVCIRFVLVRGLRLHFRVHEHVV
jgi:hypothetical protein